jgi:hypothetical protein
VHFFRNFLKDRADSVANRSADRLRPSERCANVRRPFDRLDMQMKMLTQTILAEAAAAVTVSPWARKPIGGDRFGHVQALVERCVR